MPSGECTPSRSLASGFLPALAIALALATAPAAATPVISAGNLPFSGISPGGVDMATSIHVQFLAGEQVLRFTFRNNGAPGYSWAGGALTPAKGTNTLSPFVALATRS